MSQISSLSLRIYGGALSGGLDRVPLVSVGNAPEGFVPMPPTLVDEQQSWMITHAQNYTAYMSYSKRCQTKDEQPGQLLVCLFFNPQQRLADGNSPLGLLDSLNDSFAIQAMRGGKLPSSAVDNSPFKMLLDRYRLELRPMLLPVMSGHESASFCAENRAQLDALMRHSRYPVLAGVGRLELGMHCKSTIALTSTGTSKKKDAGNEKPVLSPKSDPEPQKSEPKQQESQQQDFFGGLDLDDTPYVPESSSWYKKLLKIAAICIGILVGLFLVFTIISMIIENPNKQPYAEVEAEEITCDSVVADSTVVAGNIQQTPNDPDSTDVEVSNTPDPLMEEIDFAEEERKHAEEEARLKAAEEEAAEEARKTEEEARLKAIEAADSSLTIIR